MENIEKLLDELIEKSVAFGEFKINALEFPHDDDIRELIRRKDEIASLKNAIKKEIEQRVAK